MQRSVRGSRKKPRTSFGAGFGVDEPRVGADVVHEPALEGAHAKEPVPLFDLLDRLAALRATAVDEVLLRPVPLVGDAVPSPVRVLVEKRAAVRPLSVLQLLEGDSHDREVIGVGGADEAVVADLESVPLRLPHRREVVDVLLGREPARPRPRARPCPRARRCPSGIARPPRQGAARARRRRPGSSCTRGRCAAGR